MDATDTPQHDYPTDATLAEFLAGVPTHPAPSAAPNMDSEEVQRLVQLAQIAGVPIWLDGGWAVDALIGWQSRDHSDLDLAIDHAYLSKYVSILTRMGYQYTPTGDARLHNFVMEDNSGHRVDLHSFIRDSQGIFRGGVGYPISSLTGHGKVGHQAVQCISPRWLIDFHTGYPIDHDDYQDVKYLSNLFKLPLPGDYREYEHQTSGGRERQNAYQPPQLQVEPLSVSNFKDFQKLMATRLGLWGESGMDLEDPARAERFANQFASDPQPAPLTLLKNGWQPGLLLYQDGVLQGCVSYCPSREALANLEPGGELWKISALALQPLADNTRHFATLIGAVMESLGAHPGVRLVVEAVDDINLPRETEDPALDTRSVGYATKYNQLGFNTTEPNKYGRIIMWH